LAFQGRAPIAWAVREGGAVGRTTFRSVLVSFVLLAVALAPAGVALAPAAVAAGHAGRREGPARATVTVTRVKVVNFAFRPRSLTISAGTKVRWVVREGTHSTTSNTGLWNSGVLSQGEAFGRVFRKAGTFKYHCSVHPSMMRGVITVT
jgi:plastocyanin